MTNISQEKKKEYLRLVSEGRVWTVPLRVKGSDKITGRYWNGMDEETMNVMCLSGLIELREDEGRQKAFLTPAGEKMYQLMEKENNNIIFQDDAQNWNLSSLSDTLASNSNDKYENNSNCENEQDLPRCC